MSKFTTREAVAGSPVSIVPAKRLPERVVIWFPLLETDTAYADNTTAVCHALKGLPFDVIMELVPPAVPPLKLAVADIAPKTPVGGLGVVLPYPSMPLSGHNSGEWRWSIIDCQRVGGIVASVYCVNKKVSGCVDMPCNGTHSP